MLRKVVIDTTPDGHPITMPASVNEANFDQQVKLFIFVFIQSSHLPSRA
ncbi:MAG TPA: hypothetical protein VEU97_03050 [Ktedonobacteraceae bacterium]|nr:hypothetical protein [Ktedonobacteraceae bacterium]